MNITPKLFFQVIALFHLLAASLTAAADDEDPIAFVSASNASVLVVSTSETGSVETASVTGSGIPAFVVRGTAWPLLGGMLLLAAINSRKPSARLKKRRWRQPW